MYNFNKIVTSYCFPCQVYWIAPIFGGCVAGIIYDNAFAMNASLEKARAFLLASDYDHDQYPAKRRKVRILRDGDSDEDPELQLELNTSKESDKDDKQQTPQLTITTPETA